jgi:hypothetical protein
VKHVQAGWLRFSNENDLVRGRALVERGLRAAENLTGGEDTHLLGCSYLTRMDLLDGRLESALGYAQLVAERASARGDRATLAAARFNQCSIHCEAGRIADARRAAEDVLALAAPGENDLVGAAAQGALARVCLVEGDAASALAAAHRADELAERCGQLGLRYLALVASGYAHLLNGDARAAHHCFEALSPLGAHWPSTLLHRARGALELGDANLAAELGRRALDAPGAVRARALAVLGLATGLGGGHHDEAELLLTEAIDQCDALGLRPWRAEAQAFLAELCLRRGERTRAAHYAARATAGYAQCSMHVYAELARRLVEAG